MTAVHQFLPGFAPGDAISNEALLMQRILRRSGYESGIFCEGRHQHPSLLNEANDFRRCVPPRTEDVAILHLSIGSDVNDFFGDLPCRRMILYHNMTPADYFVDIDDDLSASLHRGRQQATRLADCSDVSLADSRFNADELTEMGYAHPAVLPLMMDMAGLETLPCERTLARLRDGRINILFVGRGAPNKNLEGCLRAFDRFRSQVPHCRFIHVGAYGENGVYRTRVAGLAAELDIRDVWLTGHVSQATLNAIYRSAHVFLCLSEHEGYCAPLVESMLFDIPIVAFAAAAVPETLGNSAVVVEDRDVDKIAGIMATIVSDSKFREGVLEGQRGRFLELTSRDLESEFLGHVSRATGAL